MLLHPFLFTTVLAIIHGVVSTPVIVDLGTSVHQATINTAEDVTYYNFSNIGYAEPPLGKLRFRKPIRPTAANRTVNDGSVERICPQAYPAWLLAGQGPSPVPGGGGNGTIPALGPVDPRESEDCLLLDVMVPQSVFNARKNAWARKLAPVLVWIHGGGYNLGAKSGNNPARLLSESVRDGTQGIVYVQLNYRLGLFGFPPRKVGDDDISSNAGLEDQRFALEWVQDNIHLFGGDKTHVTVIGESAGGGSIMHHISAYGGRKAPFNQAISQSPAWRPTSNAVFYETVYNEFLQIANVSSMDQARSLTTAQLQTAGRVQVSRAAYATWAYGSNIDDNYIPAAPGVLLAQGKLDTFVRFVVAHNSNEGLIFTDPTIQDQAGFEMYFKGLLPGASPAAISKISTLYPSDFSGTFGYTDQFNRTAFAMAEALVTCNAYALSAAYQNRTKNYIFSVPPGVHGLDIGFTFWNGAIVDDFGGVIDPAIAKAMQSSIIRFALTGNPNGPGVPTWPDFGSGATAMNFGPPAIETVTDPAAADRCQFWMVDLYSPPYSNP